MLQNITRPLSVGIQMLYLFLFTFIRGLSRRKNYNFINHLPSYHLLLIISYVRTELN